MKLQNILKYIKDEYIKTKAYYIIISRKFIKAHPEYTREIEYIRKLGQLTVFPYSFREKYDSNQYSFSVDEESGIPYTMYNEHKLYFVDTGCNDNIDLIKQKYACLASEQDVESPHRYFMDSFKVEKGDVFIDVGCAEGKEALTVLGDASEIYLFEGDEKWKVPLEKTFSDYLDDGCAHGTNVKIINKYVSDENKNGYVRLDDYIEKKDAVFIKMDVEGAECDVIKSASELVKSAKRVRVVVTCYHNKEDEKEITELLESMGVRCHTSDGWMLYYFGDVSKFVYPYFRRGVIRGEKVSK